MTPDTVSEITSRRSTITLPLFAAVLGVISSAKGLETIPRPVTYIEVRDLPSSAIVFESHIIPEPNRRFFVVYRRNAPARSDGTAYFRLEDSADCATHTKRTHYIAFDASGHTIVDSPHAPADAEQLVLKFLQTPLCAGATIAPVIAVPMVVARRGVDAYKGYQTVDELLARAREMDAAYDLVEHLPLTGKFYRPGDVGAGVTYFDLERSSLSGDEATFSWIYVVPTRDDHFKHVWSEFQGSCAAQTARRVFAAHFDDGGTLSAVDPPSSSVPLYEVNDISWWINQVCHSDLHPGWFDRTFSTLNAVLADARTRLAQR